MKSKLVVGLGNPGKQYNKTRHNVGFMAVDHLARKLKTNFRIHKKSNSEIAEIDNLILAKPTTFMNNSGRAVKMLIGYFNVTDDNVLVIYDDVDLPTGEVRYRKTGSSAGHRGMQSIIDALNTTDIKRIRIGVGRPDISDNHHNKPSEIKSTSDYVLGRFSISEIKKMNFAIARTEQIINEKFISENGD